MRKNDYFINNVFRHHLLDRNFKKNKKLTKHLNNTFFVSYFVYRTKTHET